MRQKDARLGTTARRAILCFVITLLVGVFASTLASNSFPDPARIYLWLWRPYVESHWQVDPVAHLTYFPLDYTGVGYKNQEIVPHNFFVLDDKKALRLDEHPDPYSGLRRLISPSCPDAKYDASRLDGEIYIVNNYIDDPDEPSQPCLITPNNKPTKGK